MGIIADVYFDDLPAEQYNWRSEDEDNDPDDEEWAVTPEDVVEILGFDPKDLDADLTEDSRTYVPWGGFDIRIENPIGSMRKGVDTQGKAWEHTFKDPYGYINGVRGKDKDHLDVFLGSDPLATDVFVIDQVDPYTGKFDEHKVVLGAKNIKDAKNIYMRNYQPGWKGLGAISALDMTEFRDWIRHNGPSTGSYVNYRS